MNVNEIVAGRELDALVAEKVMGIKPELIKTTREPWRYEYAPGMSVMVKPIEHYSADMGAAWQVVERMIERGDVLSLDLFQDTGPLYWSAEFRLSENGHAVADTAPLAICRAALMAVLAPYV